MKFRFWPFLAQCSPSEVSLCLPSLQDLCQGVGSEGCRLALVRRSQGCSVPCSSLCLGLSHFPLHLLRESGQLGAELAVVHGKGELNLPLHSTSSSSFSGLDVLKCSFFHLFFPYFSYHHAVFWPFLKIQPCPAQSGTHPPPTDGT